MVSYDNLLDELKATEQQGWSESNERVLLEPYRYLAEQPGKEIRSALVDAFNVWLQVPKARLDIVKSIVQQLHTASLLVDDVEDSSDLRRANPVAHKIFGVAQTINGANYVYFLALRQLAALETSTGLTLLSDVNDELLNLHRGQGMELHWRDSLECPTEEDYVQMVNNKTSGLFRVAIRLMLALAPSEKRVNLIPLVDLLGITFQICDDFQNLQSDKYSENKGFCEDLTEGKFSFPIIHSIRADPSNIRLISVLRQRPVDHSVKAWAVAYMRDHTKSFDYTRGVIHSLQAQAQAEIERLGGNAALAMILQRICAIFSPSG